MSGSDPLYDLHVHCVRKRLCDVDGISVKAALDAIVRLDGHLFVDDSATTIREISFSQEKGQEETTALTFTRVHTE